jgi:hypothetical protein
MKMATPIVSTPVRWQRLSLAETVASGHVSAACYRRTEDIDVLDQRRANTMAHIPSGLIGAEAEIAVDWACAHTLLAGQQQMNDAKPHSQIDIGILENGPGDIGEPIAALAAIRALPSGEGSVSAGESPLSGLRPRHLVPQGEKEGSTRGQQKWPRSKPGPDCRESASLTCRCAA